VLGAVPEACNPSSSQGGDGGITLLRPDGQKVSETPSQPMKDQHDGAHLSCQLCRKHK
jgi:hypothetical protein